MASEKHLQSRIAHTMEPLPSNLYARRRKTMLALGGIAVLATGFAIGAGMSMLCGNGLAAGLSALISPTSPESPEPPLHDLVVRTPMTDLSYVQTPPAPSRPVKYYGPKLTPAEAAAQKMIRGTKSILKREQEELHEYEQDFSHDSDDQEFYSRIQSRSNVEKRDVWQPSPGANWTYQLSQTPTQAQLQNASQYQIWDIDLFDTPVSSIQTIHAAGSKVICYFSAGTFENWRPDVSSFKTADIGIAMGDWPGENWVNVNSRRLRVVMAARLDLARSKGCDGVDPDTMDGYNHNTGFPLTQADAVNYMNYLAQQANARGLAIGLKNSGDIVSSVVNQVQYSVAEACFAYDECDIYQPFVQINKPVFHVEYPKGYGVVNTRNIPEKQIIPICACHSQYNFSPIVKNNNLDTWQQPCVYSS